MTGPQGGKTTVTAGGYRRVQLMLDEATIRALDAEVNIARRQGVEASRSKILRRLVRRHLPERKAT